MFLKKWWLRSDLNWQHEVLQTSALHWSYWANKVIDKSKESNLFGTASLLLYHAMYTSTCQIFFKTSSDFPNSTFSFTSGLRLFSKHLKMTIVSCVLKVDWTYFFPKLKMFAQMNVKAISLYHMVHHFVMKTESTANGSQTAYPRRSKLISGTNIVLKH